VIRPGLLAASILLAGPLLAEEPVDDTAYQFPVIPSEEDKLAALRLAFRINGNSLVGGNVMVDLTRPIPVETVKVPTTEVLEAMPSVDKPVRKPVFRPVRKTKADVCARHGLRKVTTGSSWRCRK